MSHSGIQMYIGGQPKISNRVIADSLRVSVEYIDGTATRRAANGKLWVQRSGNWKKRVVTLTGQGMGPIDDWNFLNAEAVLTGVAAALVGIVREIRAPDKDPWAAEDGFQIVIEEY